MPTAGTAVKPRTPPLPNIGAFVTPFDGREIVYWEDPRSLYWLSRTHANKAFMRLARFYEAQADKFTCGPASIAMVLNAICMESGAVPPVDAECEEFPRRLNSKLPSDFRTSFFRYTQRNIFNGNPGTKSLAEVYGAPGAGGVARPGMGLSEMQGILEANGVAAEIVPVVDLAVETHEATFLRVLGLENRYIIANFDRREWGLEGGGHVSPIGAYDMISKKALILDVNMCGRWLWIDLALLVRSMAVSDHAASRGYLVISPYRPPASG